MLQDSSSGKRTNADVEAEEAISSVILEAFPWHSTYGEETGWHNRDNALLKDQFIWVLDPIDGTLVKIIVLTGSFYNDDAKRAYDSLTKKVGKKLFNGNYVVFGFVDVVVDCALDPCPVVKGAGGVVTDWEGRELVWNA
ncbi:hypothetical protein K7X08_009490 [Anisodus acutangulus]|uniref:Uncharacterized protein n=1 Tax=Anisodus acutangulus TaxID=402998 RepID=A0A9Q1N5G9_9SOLA|nr:hypothetical protein K7X08_009490 [Anisodus acutangulus]